MAQKSKVKSKINNTEEVIKTEVINIIDRVSTKTKVKLIESVSSIDFTIKLENFLNSLDEWQKPELHYNYRVGAGHSVLIKYTIAE